MFFRDFQGWRLENSATQSLKCSNCGNTTDHYVYVAPIGIQLGAVFLKKPLLGARKHFLACPVCGNLSKELSKSQAEVMQAAKEKERRESARREIEQNAQEWAAKKRRAAEKRAQDQGANGSAMRHAKLVYALIGLVLLWALMVAFAAGTFFSGSQRSGSDAANSLPPQMPADANDSQDLVRARRLEIVDEAGKVRMELTASEQVANLRVFDRAGNPLTAFGVTDLGASLVLFRADGTPQVYVFTDEFGGQIETSATHGKGGVRIGTSAEETGAEGGAVVVLDRAGNPVTTAQIIKPIPSEVPTPITLPPEPSLAADSPKTIVNSLGMKLVLIPRGEFLMGSPESEEGRQKNEGPQHRVQITRPFYLGTTEVTQGQWEKVMGTAPWTRPPLGRSLVTEGADYPANCMSWDDAVAFCETLSRQDDRTYRLPTEAEWEYACRADSQTRYSNGDDPELLTLVGNVADATAKRRYEILTNPTNSADGYELAAPVGKFKPNAFGLYDMHGNVNEWCSDAYASSYYAESPVSDPPGPATRKEHVARGGHYFSAAQFCRSASRSPSVTRNDAIGFRVAFSPR
jgi:sulfatase modifying factor 1